MNLDVFSNNIQNIGKLRTDVADFYKLVCEIRKDEDDVKVLESHITSCKGVRTELDMERRNHAEELRQINQDINSLEDMTKSSKSELEKRRRKVTVAVGEMDKLRNCINEKLEAMNILHKLEASDEETGFKQTWQTTPTPMLPDLPAFLQSLLSSTQNSAEAPNNLVNRHRMPPSFVEASKMKICENCGANIHRNAPTCPVCKMKTRSKNPKKKAKKAYSSSMLP